MLEYVVDFLNINRKYVESIVLPKKSIYLTNNCRNLNLIYISHHLDDSNFSMISPRKYFLQKYVIDQSLTSEIVNY